MKFEEYVATSTATDAPMPRSTAMVHMSMGIASEVREAMIAIDEGDLFNIREELGDQLWYIAKGFRLFDIRLSETDKLVLENHLYTDEMVMNSLLLVDIMKKLLAYNKQPEDSTVVAILKDQLRYVAAIANQYSLSMSDILEANLKKLRARYRGSFSAERAINRDTAAERRGTES